MPFYYIRPDEMPTATVTTTAGATNAAYTDDWICDGRPGRPARSTNGTVTWSAAFSSAEVGLIAVCNCNSDVNASIGGGITATVTAGALEANGIRLNGFTAPTPASITGLTVGFSGAAVAVTLGEFVFGKRRTLTNAAGNYGGPRFDGEGYTLEDYPLTVDAEFGSTMPYDRGLVSRTLRGTQVYTVSQFADLLAWQKAQRSGSKPSLIVPDSTVNDAWLVTFRITSYKNLGNSLIEASIEFVEYPRSRW